MNRIIEIETVAKNIKRMVLEAPLIAKNVKAGQFVSVSINEKSERIPLTVVESDKNNGSITLIFLEVGKTTFSLGRLRPGDEILSLLGPLGKPTDIRHLGSVITIGGGVGIAEIYPVTKAFKQAGNHVICIIGSKSKDMLILENEIRGYSDELYITTDDGSQGNKGFTSDILNAMLEKGNRPDLVYAVGPVAMMKVIAETTRPHKVKTLVSLNPIMVDATGMCGSCRVNVGGKTLFGCVDGPEFDAHLVDFNELTTRLSLFNDKEKVALESCKCQNM